MTTPIEDKVLDAFRALTRADEEGAWNPYYTDIAVAANGDSELAYSICKKLKREGLLDCNRAQRGGLFNAPAYWATDKALAA